MKIFLIGPPGSGKTTINLHISQRLNLNYISYRHLVLGFLNKKNKKSKKSKESKELWLSFKPFPPNQAFEILENHLSQMKSPNYALDGFPKSKKEAALLVKYLTPQDNSHSYTFILELEKSAIFERLKKRLVCPNCFYVNSEEKKENIISPICPYCHTSLIKRMDDEYDKINYRINRYLQEKEGIIKEMKKISQVYFINANNSLAEIINEILEKLLSEKEKNLLWETEKGARLILEGLGVDLANPNITKTPIRMQGL